jgi:hypothetical protein
MSEDELDECEEFGYNIRHNMYAPSCYKINSHNNRFAPNNIYNGYEEFGINIEAHKLRKQDGDVNWESEYIDKLSFAIFREEDFDE